MIAKIGGGAFNIGEIPTLASSEEPALQTGPQPTPQIASKSTARRRRGNRVLARPSPCLETRAGKRLAPNWDEARSLAATRWNPNSRALVSSACARPTSDAIGLRAKFDGLPTAGSPMSIYANYRMIS